MASNVETNHIYRYWDDETGALVYLGETHRPKARASEHRRNSDWWTPELRVEVDAHPDTSIDEILQIEANAIKAERPTCNRYRPSMNSRQRRIRVFRTLQTGERVPSHTPTRTLQDTGYIVLRWTVSPNVVVRVLEHRVGQDGIVVAAEHVHHINGDRSDNRPENLEYLDAKTHQAHHHHRIHLDEIGRLYGNGLKMREVAEELGTSIEYVCRLMAENGIESRDPADYIDVPRPTADQLVEAKARLGTWVAVADELGVTVEAVRYWRKRRNIYAG